MKISFRYGVPSTAALVSAVCACIVLANRTDSSRPASGWQASVAAFDQELQDLQGALAIPGLAYAIVERGQVVHARGFGTAHPPDTTSFSLDTPLRIASVTKALTGVVAMQMVESGRLILDAPARSYVQALALPESVTVRHLLTHTAEGQIGTEYVYGTNRYAMLGQVIEAITDSSLHDVLSAHIVRPAGMHGHESPHLGAHAGLVSTTRDMGAFLATIDRGMLLSEKGLTQLATPSRSIHDTPLPVSLGWFAQTVQGERVMWSFGQDDPEHSGALLVRLPDRQLSVFIFANSNVLSDPFRLLMGDVTKSPFAMAFLRLFAFSAPGAPIVRPARNHVALAAALDSMETAHRYRFRDELIGWAMMDLWTEQVPGAEAKLMLVRSRYPHAVDPVMHFASAMLSDTAQRDLGIRDGAQLLIQHPLNRWMLLSQGELLQSRGRMSEAKAHFERILALPNQHPDFLSRLFKAWSWMALAQMSAPTDTEAARRYLGEILGSAVTGETRAGAQRMLDSLTHAGTPSRLHGARH